MSSSTEAAERPFEPVRFATREGGSGRPGTPSCNVPWGELACDLPAAETADEPAAASGSDGSVGEEAAGCGNLLFDEEELARICAAVAWGVRSAEREAAELRRAEARAAALARFEACLEALVASGDRAWAELQSQMAEVVRLLAAAAMPALVARFEREEVAKAVSDLLARLGPEEELRIHVRSELAEDLRERLAVDSGITGNGIRWQLVAEEGLPPGDFRIERHHGFLERRTEEICEQIRGAVEVALAGSGRAGEGAGDVDDGLQSGREQDP